MIRPSDHKLFERVVGENRTFVVSTHMNPDGDALGSQLAIARFLRDRNLKVRLINQDATPSNLSFLEGSAEIEVFDADRHIAVLEEVDRIVLVDNSAPDRFGRMESALLDVAGKTLCIDHHPTRGTPWKDNILDTAACATAAMIYTLVTETGWEPDPSSSLALYVGIATDTGFFRFNSTTAEAHEIAAKLIGSGVDPALPYQEIYEGNSEAYTRLMGHALAGLELAANGAIASVCLTQDLLDRCDAHDVDSSEITTALLAMKSVRIATLFRDLPDDKIKVSLRSKADVDVHTLATQFGGGGHRNASGIVVEGTMDEVVPSVIAKAVLLLLGGDAA